MNKFLFQTTNGDIYSFIEGIGWQVIANGEPTDVMFIQKGMTSISNSNLAALISLSNSSTIDMLASKQGDNVKNELLINNNVDLGNGLSYNYADVDLSQYTNVINVTIEGV